MPNRQDNVYDLAYMFGYKPRLSTGVAQATY
jgi:hypothetical protein